jgi:hypothetical protein
MGCGFDFDFGRCYHQIKIGLLLYEIGEALFATPIVAGGLMGRSYGFLGGVAVFVFVIR